MSHTEPPILDFSPIYKTDPASKEQLIQRVQQACESFGFFQLINHGIPVELQNSVIEQTKKLFSLPLDIKEKYDKDVGGYNRGYERLRAQNFNKQTKGDLKEGFYLGKNLPPGDPNVIAKRFGQSPNKYPAELQDPKAFQQVMEEYHAAMTTLAIDVLRTIASTLNLDQSYFDDFCEKPVATLRLLHYPPQDPATMETERGIGAHTDFGAITMLLQDDTGGLQVWSNSSSEWVDITPIPGAYVVNLGNMMMRWTNDRYLSNLHRVINRSGKERFSIPFFFSGNPEYTIECLPGCAEEKSKYPPISVHDWMTGRFADTYGSPDEKALADLRQEVVSRAHK